MQWIVHLGQCGVVIRSFATRKQAREFVRAAKREGWKETQIFREQTRKP